MAETDLDTLKAISGKCSQSLLKSQDQGDLARVKAGQADQPRAALLAW